MKVAVLLAYAVLTTKRISCAAINAPLDIISLDDISEQDRKTLEFLDQHYPRPKRSHEHDLLNTLKSAVGNGIKSKLGLIAKGSASAVSHFSGGSSGGGHSYHHYDTPETYDHKSFDFWSLKKSILNTLLQAVKAIKGGVIAIKGQLIKGSGYLISAKGKLISAKGEAITSLGKNIASSAILSPYPHHHSGPAHIEYVEPHGHYHSSGPSEEYGAPSAPGPEYVSPDHHHVHHEDKPDSDHAGILILKKIPSDHDHEHHHSDEHPKYVPDFKPLKPTGPSLGTIVGKFFSASTSLKPGEPAPFGDSGPGESSYHSHDLHHEPEPPHDHLEHHHHHTAPSHDSHEHYPHDSHPPSSHKHVEYYPEHPSGPTGPSKPPSGPPSDTTGPSALPENPPTGPNLKPPSTNYGTPFEDAPSYLNYAEYTSESKKNPHSLPSSANHQAAKPSTQNTKPIVYDEIRPLSQALVSAHGFDSTLLANSYEKPNLFVGTQSSKANEQFPPYPTAAASSEPSTSYNLDSFAQFGGFKNPEASPSSNVKYLAPPGPLFQTNSNNFNSMPSFMNYPLQSPYSPNLKYKSHSNKIPSSVLKAPPKRAHRSKLSVVGHKKPGIEVVRSIGFEIGPNGPKRL